MGIYGNDTISIRAYTPASLYILNKYTIEVEKITTSLSKAYGDLNQQHI
ncbi:hypothetical protein SAMN02787073_3582 [Chryseobacterium vrystaatense]|uniref:Uncharacterized protein n=1 Tax=Chryseobacterium vrystaatense TaxID=307480 RepID=A0A1M5H5D5_9FLAO|nr:hypothetical protein SAMN02787073_3582 [Chryseobacterium vrystaatense]